MVQEASIPALLKAYSHWVCWAYVWRGEGKKPDKRPINPRNLHNAGVHWPNTWGSFEQAFATYQEHDLAGVGFVLTPDDPLLGVDLDGCVQDEAITDTAQAAIAHLSSYTELSPSGKGLRILAASPGYQENHKTKSVEIYSHARFVTVTGHHVAGTPEDIIHVDPATLQGLLPPHVAPATATPHEAKPFAGTDAQLWAHIFERDRYGADHLRRFQGDLSLDGHDHSLCVLRLLNTLARWTNGDAVRMRALILQSPLANEKWFSKRGAGDWIGLLIADACRYVRGGK